MSAPDLGALVYRGAMALQARVARVRRATVTVDGLPMALYQGGPAHAPVVLLIHGYTADKDCWTPFAAHLSRTYRVVIPDLAGHGDTPFRAGAGYSAPAQAERVRGLMDRLGIGRAHVIGNSMGGFVAATLALHHPDRVLSLGLCDAAGVTGRVPSDLQVMLDAGSNPFLISRAADFPAFYRMTMAKPPFAPGFVIAAVGRQYAARRESYVEIFADFHDSDQLDADLGGIIAPTLVLWGEEDQLVSRSAADVWTAGIPGARLIAYPGIGHMPMMEIPRRSARDYRDFLAGLR